MPRISDETSTLIVDFAGRLDRLIAAARQEGRETALAEVRSLVGGAAADGARRATPTSAPATPASMDGRRNSWSGMTPAARLQRVNAIRRGKGLPPKDKL